MTDEIKEELLEQVSGGEAPELPATTLAEAAYQNMFSGMGNLADNPPVDAGKYKIGINVNQPNNYEQGSPVIPGFSIQDPDGM